MDLRDEKVRKKMIRCQYHKDENYSMFCTTCDCLVCTSCILDNHYKQHEFCKIKEAFQKKHTEFFQMLHTKKESSDVEAEPAAEVTATESEHAEHETAAKITATESEDVEHETAAKVSATESKDVESEPAAAAEVSATESEDFETQPAADVPDKRSEGQGEIWLESLMLKKLDEIKSQEMELSSFCDTVSKKINNRMDLLKQNLDTERQSLLNKVANAKSALMYNRNNKKEEMELCISYLKIYETDPEFVDGLDEIFRLRITELCISVLENSGSKDSLDVSALLTYTDPDETTVTEAIKTLVGDVICSLDVTDYCGKQVQCAKTDDKAGGIDTEDMQKKILAVPFKEITKIIPKDDNCVYILGTHCQNSTTVRGLFKTDMKRLTEQELICKNVIDACDGPDQCIHFCKEDSSVIFRCTKDGKYFHFFDCGPETYARCVHFVSGKNEILVGSEQCRIVGSKCAERLQFCLKTGVFDIMGQRMKIIEDKFYEDDAMSYPQRIINGETSPLLILTFRSKKHGRGIVFDPTAKKIFFQGTIGLQPGASFHPTGICVDDRGRFLISDYKNNVVFLLNPDGTFKKTLVSGEDGVTCQTAVFLDKKGYLWVGCDEKILVVKYEQES